MMFLFRAKTKVRYAILVVSVVVLLSMLKLNLSSLTGTSASFVRVNEGKYFDIIRRSFSPAWHDGRELLNDMPRTHKTQNLEGILDTNHQKNDDDNLQHLIPQKINSIKEMNKTKLKLMNRDFHREQGNTESPGMEIEQASNNQRLFVMSKTNAEISEIRGNKESHTINEIDVTTQKDGQESVTKEMRSDNNKTEEVLGNDEDKNDDHQRENHAEQKETDNSTLKDSDDREEDDNESQEDDDEDDEEVANETSKSSNKTIFDTGDSLIQYYMPETDVNPQNYPVQNESKESEESDWKRIAGNLPMSPQDAVIRFGNYMPWWERLEILNYPKVWFLGLNANKSRFEQNQETNFGFDHDPDTPSKGYFKVVVGDHIGYRYEIIKYLGSGTFGLVVVARDWSHSHNSGGYVAVKIMHLDDDESYIVREINMMKYMEINALNHDYFSRMIASFQFRNHKCLVLELLGSPVDRHSLGHPIRNLTLLRQYAEDIFRGMYFLHQMNIVHGDLKPENIMYVYGKNNESTGQLLKVADFGIGCVQNTRVPIFNCPAYYIQTRYYRSPEVILGLPFTTQIDIWSVGIILAEFYLGIPPFFGETETDQLAAMMEVLGLPPTHMVAKSHRKKIYSKAICYTTENGFHRKPYRKPLKKVLKGMDPALYDLITRCFEYDPRMRITAEQALRHPFITKVFPAIGLPPSNLAQRMAGII